MRIKKVFFTLLALGLMLQSSWAVVRTDMVFGIRDGMALGIQSHDNFNDNWQYRYGVEASTGDDLSFQGVNPFILYVGLSRKFIKLGWSPTEISFNFVTESGTAVTEFGPGLSWIMHNINNQNNLSLEFGIDYIRYHGHILAQVGYQILP